jgi:hypothetical protein
MFVFAIWFGMNSDCDIVPSLLNQLIPAGHCACETSTVFQCSECFYCPLAVLSGNSSVAKEENSVSSQIWTYQYPTDANNEGLTQAQCESAFPGLFHDINRAISFWNISGGTLPHKLQGIRIVNGMTRARILHGQLYIVQSLAKGEDHRRKILGVLSSIHCALVAAPDRGAIKNIEFIFSVEDLISDVAGRNDPIWALARKAHQKAAWLYPDFGLWAWDNLNHEIGPYSQVVDAIIKLEKQEQEVPQKLWRLVWRGKLSFAPKLRRALLEVVRGQIWSDVKELDWRKKDNFISMENHCRWMFIAHVEGMFLFRNPIEVLWSTLPRSRPIYEI